MPKEVLHKDKVEVGAIALDAAFTPVRRANYEVENMRVGDRTDYNRLRVFIETDGVISPRESLEKSIDIMIAQLRSIRGFQTEEVEASENATDMLPTEESEGGTAAASDVSEDAMKTKIEELGLSSRTVNSLADAGVRTVGGLARKKEEDLLEIDGIGDKGIKEIRRALSNYGIVLK